MKLTIQRVEIASARYSDPMMETFFRREKEAMSLAKKEFFNKENPTLLYDADCSKFRFFDEVLGTTIYVSYPNKWFENFLIVLFKICQRENLEKNSADQILRKVYSPGYLYEIFPRGDFYPSYLESYESFENVLKSNSFIYFDDGTERYFFNIYGRFDTNRQDNSKLEFTGGILHVLTRHYEFFNRFNPSPNGNLGFSFCHFIQSIIKICVFGDVIKVKPTQYQDENIIEKTMNLRFYHKSVLKEERGFKVILRKRANGLNYLTFFGIKN
jgi:hypothetical protein